VPRLSLEADGACPPSKMAPAGRWQLAATRKGHALPAMLEAAAGTFARCVHAGGRAGRSAVVKGSERLSSRSGGLEKLDNLHLRNKHEPLVGDADFRNHRERDQVEAHIGNGAACLFPFCLQGLHLLCNLGHTLV